MFFRGFLERQLCFALSPSYVRVEIVYSSNSKASQRQYLEEEVRRCHHSSCASSSTPLLFVQDQFLLCLTAELGYGQWAALKAAIRDAFQFRFDWWLKSRAPVEVSEHSVVVCRRSVVVVVCGCFFYTDVLCQLGRRVDALVRLIEREEQEKNGVSPKKSDKSNGKRKPSENESSQKKNFYF